MTTSEILKLVAYMFGPSLSALLVWAFWVTRNVRDVAEVKRLYNANIPEIFVRLNKCEKHMDKEEGMNK